MHRCKEFSLRVPFDLRRGNNFPSALTCPSKHPSQNKPFNLGSLFSIALMSVCCQLQLEGEKFAQVHSLRIDELLMTPSMHLTHFILHFIALHLLCILYLLYSTLFIVFVISFLSSSNDPILVYFSPKSFTTLRF